MKNYQYSIELANDIFSYIKSNEESENTAIIQIVNFLNSKHIIYSIREEEKGQCKYLSFGWNHQFLILKVDKGMITIEISHPNDLLDEIINMVYLDNMLFGLPAMAIRENKENSTTIISLMTYGVYHLIEKYDE